LLHRSTKYTEHINSYDADDQQLSLFQVCSLHFVFESFGLNDSISCY
jgi:hypothetical protein